jgi:hypothetical protein
LRDSYQFSRAHRAIGLVVVEWDRLDLESRVRDLDPLFRAGQNVLPAKAEHVELVEEVLAASLIPLDDAKEWLWRNVGCGIK